MDRSGDGHGRVRVHAARRDPDEPEELASDLPWPALWSPAVGSAGETLGPKPDLVPLEAGSAQRPSTPPAASGAGPRRRPGRSQSRSTLRGGDSRRPRPSLHLPSLGVVVATGALAGLLGLAVATAVVLFSFGGNAPAARDDGRVVAMTVPARTIVDVAEQAAAFAKREARARETARERHRAQVRHTREVVRRRALERERAPVQSGGVRTTQVTSPPPASTPSTAPAPTVSPAEREFTPGPWNLS